MGMQTLNIESTDTNRYIVAEDGPKARPFLCLWLRADGVWTVIGSADTRALAEKHGSRHARRRCNAGGVPSWKAGR